MCNIVCKYFFDSCTKLSLPITFVLIHTLIHIYICTYTINFLMVNVIVAIIIITCICIHARYIYILAVE